MKVIWTRRAYRSWQEIALYISKTFGQKALQDFQQKTLQWEATISAMPQVGRIEPLLQGLPKMYRSVVVDKHSKMIYSIEEHIIKIDAFWDTRREPKQQATNI